MTSKQEQKIKFRFIEWFVISIILLLVVSIIWTLIYFFDFSKKAPEIGVTFSKSYSEQLGLDWKETYTAIIEDLEVKKIRLVSQWDEVEPIKDVYDFAHLDWMLQMAKKNDVEVILALGRRTPRWPECHDPSWLGSLDEKTIEREQLAMVEDVIMHFRSFDNITIWQVENEPFLTSFGICPDMPMSLLKKEVALVKSLDKRPILLTDSGELGDWNKVAGLGDKFGHTLYRLVYNEYFGYMHYYFPPAFYRIKAWATGLDQKDIMVAELQAEPWVAKGFTLQLDYDAMMSLMNTDKVESNLAFARKTGAPEIYLWGVEWWYWLKTEKGNAELWDLAKNKISQY